MVKKAKNFEEVLDRLEKQDLESNLRAVRLIGKLGDASDVDQLMEYLQDEDSFVRYKALEALDKLIEREELNKTISLQSLFEALKDDDGTSHFSVRLMAAIVLEKLACQDIAIKDHFVTFLQENAAALPQNILLDVLHLLTRISLSNDQLAHLKPLLLSLVLCDTTVDIKTVAGELLKQSG